jgi:hypothetical protein
MVSQREIYTRFAETIAACLGFKHPCAVPEVAHLLQTSDCAAILAWHRGENGYGACAFL